MVLVEVASKDQLGLSGMCLADDCTVRSLKKIIRKKTGIPCIQQKLVYCGKSMEDEKTLESYDLPRSGGYGKVYLVITKMEEGVEAKDYSDEESSHCTIM
jgi:hypothetical protein